MKLQLFGHFAVVPQVGGAVQFATKKVRALAAYLAAHANEPIARPVLATLFWEESSQQVGNKNLRNSLSRLKKALSALNRESDGVELVVTRQTVELRVVSPAVIDVEMVAAMWAHCHLTERNLWVATPEIVKELEQLVAHYAGDFLADLDLSDCIEFDSWVVMQREMVHQQVLQALETIVQAHIGQHQFVSAEKYAHQHLALERWSEAAHGALIQIYQLTNRPQLAQRQLEQCRAIFLEAFGAEPDLQLVAQPAAEPVELPIPIEQETELAPPSAPKHNLSAEINAFLGREQEIEQLKQLLTDGNTRIVTLHGGGGIGKTRLARAVAATLLDTFSNRVCFVSLVSVNEPSGVVSAIIEAYGIQLVGISPPFEQLCDALREQKTLLIIDNLEHLMDEDGELVDLLLDLHNAAPQLTLLLTSRQQLWVRAETVMRLTELPYPDESVNGTWQQFAAVQLFTDRLRQLDANFDPISNRESILTICRAVQGLPLGLELAAAQASMRSCADVSAELIDGQSLRTRMRDVPKRQRSLKKVFDYSWQLLDGAVRPILARCAIMRGDFDYDAFRAITGGQRDELETLIANALVRHVGEGRYDIHELVRQGAVAKLADSDKTATVERHIDYFLGFVREREATIYTEFDTVVPRIQKEWPHIQQAWEWIVEHNSIAHIHDTITALRRYWIVSNKCYEAMSMADAATHVLEKAGASHPLYPMTTLRLGALKVWVCYYTGQNSVGFTTAQTLQTSYSIDDDPEAYLCVLIAQGIYLSKRFQVQEAIEVLTTAYELAKQYGVPILQMDASYTLGYILENNRRTEEAKAWMKRSHKTIAGSSNRYLQFQLYKQQLMLHTLQWHLGDAIDCYEQYQAMLTKLTIHRQVESPTFHVSKALLKCGRYRYLLTFLESHSRTYQNMSRRVNVNLLMARANYRLERYDDAMIYAQQALKHSDIQYSAQTIRMLAKLLCATGRVNEALTSLRAFDLSQTNLLKQRQLLIVQAHAHTLLNEWDAAYDITKSFVAPFLAMSWDDLPLDETQVIYQTLIRVADPSAENLFAHAHGAVVYRATQISDPDYRRSFLENVTENRYFYAHPTVIIDQEATYAVA